MIKVQIKDFNIGLELDGLQQNGADPGAIVSFTGLVRRGSEDRKISSMILEHYPGMTERELERIEHQARERWQLDDCLIIHRTGELFPGDNIVLVATLARHRAEAFAAAQFLMDHLKTSAPFWKKEISAISSQWVEAKTSDAQATKIWRDQDK